VLAAGNEENRSEADEPKRQERHFFWEIIHGWFNVSAVLWRVTS